MLCFSDGSFGCFQKLSNPIEPQLVAGISCAQTSITSLVLSAPSPLYKISGKGSAKISGFMVLHIRSSRVREYSQAVPEKLASDSRQLLVLGWFLAGQRNPG